MFQHPCFRGFSIGHCDEIVQSGLQDASLLYSADSYVLVHTGGRLQRNDES